MTTDSDSEMYNYYLDTLRDYKPKSDSMGTWDHLINYFNVDNRKFERLVKKIKTGNIPPYLFCLCPPLSHGEVRQPTVQATMRLCGAPQPTLELKFIITSDGQVSCCVSLIC